MVREITVKKLQYRVRSLEAKLRYMENYNSRKHFNYDLDKFLSLEKEVEIQKCYIENQNG